jgi:outer membrane protein OmpA-like peptidoglycan-associated protein
VVSRFAARFIERFEVWSALSIRRKEGDMELSSRRIGVVLVAIGVLSGCAAPMTQRERGALTGAALGAGTGALIGSTRGDAAEGAAIGGAIGAVGGGLLGHQLEQRAQAGREQDARIAQQREEIARNRELLDDLRRRDLDARETSRGVVVNLPDVLFEFARADLTPDAERKVRDIADVLDGRARSRRVSVEGHTDSIGSESYNERLSVARAESVAEALVEDGVTRRRLTSRGFGERQPVAPNEIDGRDNPRGRAKNRRVEVVIEN